MDIVLDAAKTAISVAVARRTLSFVAIIEVKFVVLTNVVIVRRLAIVSAFAINQWYTLLVFLEYG